MKIPKRTEKQIKEAKSKCATILRKYQNLDFVLDDESYFTLSHSTINGNNNFYTSNVNLTSPNIKFNSKAKYEEKLLVWLAASPREVSDIFIAPSNLAIDSKIYQNECLIKRLIPFIKKNYSDKKYVFWPDLASSHYSETTMDCLIENDINYIEKYENPANCPEIRPIEDFWSILKGEVYKGGWKAENLKKLENRIRYCLKKIKITSIHHFFKGTHRRLDRVRRYGVIEY